LPTKTTDRNHRRSTLLILVFGASLSLVAVTAIALFAVVSEHVTTAAIDSSVRSDRSLVRAFVATSLVPADLQASGVDPVRIAAIEGQLTAFIDRRAASDRAAGASQSSGILHIKIWAPDGTVLYSERSDLRGQNLGLDADISEAIAGRTATTIEEAGSGEAATSRLPVGTEVLEEYIPIEMAGSVPAVFEVYRDAGPILEAVDATRREVLLVTLLASAVLAALLYLIFRAAQGRLSRQTAELVETGRRDAWTGLLNHGAAVGELATLLESSRPSGAPVGVALVDIDNFRLLNDTYGHSAGDQALADIAGALRAELSEATIVGRYGPDEFILIAPPQCVSDIEPAIDRLRHRIAQLSLQFGGSERLPVTVSAGVCYAPTHGAAATELLAVATGALTEAKAGGGNGVRVADRTPDDLAIAQRSSFDVLTGLVAAVDTKDRYTKQHSEDVARYAVFLAERLDLAAEDIRSVELAGLLHDVGKIGIPDAILRKPGPLTTDEYAIVKQHVWLGAAIVRDLPNVEAIRAGVRHHHERWDGSGYLDGLAGEAIPLIARVVAIADAFSAMTTSRPYRKALSVDEALERLRAAAGSQLDPRLVTVFVTGIETDDDPPLPGDGRSGGSHRAPIRSVA
jgi:diguanylate cyclase (GGDEF)-like protein/putative nucleotidyltransferase with HDIG domain